MHIHAKRLDAAAIHFHIHNSFLDTLLSCSSMSNIPTSRGFGFVWKVVSSSRASSSPSEQCCEEEWKLLFECGDTATPQLVHFQQNISKVLLPVQFAAYCRVVPVCELATRQVSFINSIKPNTLTTGRINTKDSAQQLVERNAFAKAYQILVIIKLLRAMRVLRLLGSASHPLCTFAQRANQESVQRFSGKELQHTLTAGNPTRLFWNERAFRALNIDVCADVVLFANKPSTDVGGSRDVRLSEESRQTAPLIKPTTCNGEEEKEEKGRSQIAESVPPMCSEASELINTHLLWTSRLARRRASKPVAVARLRKRRAKRRSSVRVHKTTKADKRAETRNLTDVTLGGICGSLNHRCPHGNIRVMPRDFSVAKRLLGMV